MNSQCEQAICFKPVDLNWSHLSGLRVNVVPLLRKKICGHLSSCRTVLFNQGHFRPPGDIGNIGRHFGFHNLDCRWYLVGGGLGCCSTSYNALGSPSQLRISWPQMSVVPKLRNPALRFEKSEDNYTKNFKNNHIWAILVLVTCFSQFL